MNLCCLTLVFQKSVEETLVDFMLANAAANQGFTTSQVDGHGHDSALVSMNEKVRGRARKVRMDIVLGEAEADGLLTNLEKSFPNLKVTYWLSPVSKFGRIA